MLTFIILKIHLEFCWACFEGEKGLETTRQGCLETKVPAVASVPRGQQQPSRLR